MPRRDDAYKLARRAEIVDAARAAALRKGVPHITMRDIADEAGVSMGAITNYFDRREQIVHEAAERNASRRRQWLASLAERDDPVAAFVDALTRASRDGDEAALELGLVAEARHDEGLREVMQASATNTVGDIAALLAESGVDPRRARAHARLALAAYHGLLAMNLLDQDPPRTRAAEMLTHLLQGDSR